MSKKQEICSFILARDVPGERSLSRDICPALVPGQRDTGTRIFFLSQDKGTTGRPVPVCPGTSRLVETLVLCNVVSDYKKCSEV